MVLKKKIMFNSHMSITSQRAGAACSVSSSFHELVYQCVVKRRIEKNSSANVILFLKKTPSYVLSCMD